jgi:hypothetical protein
MLNEKNLLLVSDGAFISGAVSTLLPNTYVREQYAITKLNT